LEVDFSGCLLYCPLGINGIKGKTIYSEFTLLQVLVQLIHALLYWV